MPRDASLGSVLLIGSGPIVVGQACEFDYSGVQAVRALREEGVRVVLLNPNPATVMTEPGMCDATYLEPLRPWVVRRILERERVDGVLTTLGGQSALNLAVECAERGIWQKHGVRLLGADVEAISTAEDREAFRRAMASIGLPCSRGEMVRSVDEGLAVAASLGYPVILRPSFTLGGEGGGAASSEAQARELLAAGLRASPAGSVQVEESLVCWKEFELEVIRDHADNGILVCSIENVDPMGVHTGDSITVAPAQTLTDRELQTLRDWSLRILRRIGVACGGSNVQFALHPATGRLVVVEMNPRVSRSSALASKATGYPIARVATLLALGYTLDELPNRITGTTVAAFEPSLDYVCVKVPRWAFEKFPHLRRELSTRMQSIGEVMALGRTFAEALGKAVRSLETRSTTLLGPAAQLDDDALAAVLGEATPDRLFHIAEAFRRGWPRQALAGVTSWDPWFLDQIAQMVDGLTGVASCRGGPLHRSQLAEAKALGLSDAELGRAAGLDEGELAARRPAPAYRGVDTCAGEFAAATPYFYSAYGVEGEGEGLGERAVVVLGSGPNRIGQGLEFDTCCVEAVQGLRDEGLAPVLHNCNPETVSTDFDTADRLYFEPVTAEDVLEVCRRERPRGVIVGLGGQTPLKVASALERAGVPILGTPPAGIALAEDRRAFAALCGELGLAIPASRTACGHAEALRAAAELGYPLVLRPSFVLGGEGMAIVWSEAELAERLATAVRVSDEHPLLLDRFLEDAVEADLDVLTDGDDVHPCGVLEHVEPAGIHSGDSMQVFPPQTLSPEVQATMLEAARVLCRRIGAVGLANCQFAVAGGTLYLLEVNPRASRTVPFLHKAAGAPWARLAARLMAGRTLAELRPPIPDPRGRVWVKVPVFPFARFGVDPVLGPEMRSTGEALGSGPTLGAALTKALRAAGVRLPERGGVFVSLADRDKHRPKAAELARRLGELGLDLYATAGTAGFLGALGLGAAVLGKLGEGATDTVRLLREGRIGLVLNTPRGGRGRTDAGAIRLAALQHSVPCMTTLEGALAACEGVRALRTSELDIAPL